MKRVKISEEYFSVYLVALDVYLHFTDIFDFTQTYSYIANYKIYKINKAKVRRIYLCTVNYKNSYYTNYVNIYAQQIALTEEFEFEFDTSKLEASSISVSHIDLENYTTEYFMTIIQLKKKKTV